MKILAAILSLAFAAALPAQTVQVKHKRSTIPSTVQGVSVLNYLPSGGDPTAKTKKGDLTSDPIVLAALTPPGLPAAPTGTPVPVAQNFTVGWTDTNPATRQFTGYHLKWGTVSGGPYTAGSVDVIGKATLTKAFTAFPLGNYFMICTAYDALTESKASNELPLTVITSLLSPATLGVTDTGLTQMSTRGNIGEEDRSMIAGFFLENPKTIVTRALGPSLGQFGVPNPIANTRVELHDGSGATIASNNGWRNDPRALELIAMGLAPSDDKESALISDLADGSYTAVVSGSAPEGVGLVELYQAN